MSVRLSLALMALLGGCALRSAPVDPSPTPRSEWPALVAQASQEVNAGRFGVADRLLSDFSVRYPASAEAAESQYWRAVYKLDPANPNASPREASVLLESYLTSGATAHRSEAATLRRVSGVLESRAATTAGTSPPRNVATPAAPADDKAKDDEIARLKDELAKANAELERIKKRLAQPTKP